MREINPTIAGRWRAAAGSGVVVVCGADTFSNPSAELVPGDDLVLVGSHAEVDAAYELLQRAAASNSEDGRSPT